MQAWHTEQHHINTSQYKDCWFYGKPTGCRYNKHTCRFRHKIGNNSALGTLFHLNKQMENNQVQLWQQLQGLMVLIQQVLTNQNELLSRDSPPKYTPKPRKSRSKRHKLKHIRNSSSDDDDSGAISDTVDAQTTQSYQRNTNELSDDIDNDSVMINTAVSDGTKDAKTSISTPQTSEKTTNMGGQLSSEDVAMDGVTAAAASGGSKRHCECKEPQRIAVTAVQNPVVSQRVGPRQISQNPPSYSPPRYPKHPSQDKKKKKKTQTKKKVLNPYAHVFSKGGLYDTGYKDTKCKDKMKVYPPPKARSHTRQTTGDFTPKSKPKPSQYLASIGLNIQPKQPKNLQRNMPPKSPQKKANPSNYSPPGHPKHSRPSHTQNTAKFIDKMGVFHGVPHHYPLESYLKNVQLLISNSTEDRISNIISHYARACKQDRILNQSHPMYFIEYVLNTTMKGKLTIKHVDILEIFEEKYPRSLLWITAVAPITTDTTFTDLMNELFHELDKENVEYNDIDNVISEKQHVKHDHHKFP
eukprot:642568_1